MKKYVIQKGDTFGSLSQKFKIKDEGSLKTFHNLYCDEKDIMQEPVPGKEILIPEDPQFLMDNSFNNIEDFNGFDMDDEMSGNETEEEEQDESNEKKEEKGQERQDSGSSEHDGKYFVIQKGMCQCDQGFKFPKFKVSSHQKHYWNDKEGQSDYLAVTEDDLTLDPPAMPFGNCKLKPSSGGYLPCAYAPSGKWQKTYGKVKVMEKKCVTELSELMCATGGKITIFKHGQQSEAGKSNVNKADTQEQHVYNPIMDYEEFKEGVNEDYEYQ